MEQQPEPVSGVTIGACSLPSSNSSRFSKSQPPEPFWSALHNFTVWRANVQTLGFQKTLVQLRPMHMVQTPYCTQFQEPCARVDWRLGVPSHTIRKSRAMGKVFSNGQQRRIVCDSRKDRTRRKNRNRL